MLAFLENSTWTRWTNQPRPLNGDGSYQLPRNAAAVYGDDDLAAYGLVRVIPAEEVPPPRPDAGYRGVA